MSDLTGSFSRWWQRLFEAVPPNLDGCGSLIRARYYFQEGASTVAFLQTTLQDVEGLRQAWQQTHDAVRERATR